MSGTSIEGLLQDPRIWHAGRAAHAAPLANACVPSGWSSLDRALGGGWPLGQLTELLLDARGIGELSLLVPALLRLGEEQQDADGGARRGLALVAPPELPYAPALAHGGLELERVLLIRTKHDRDTLWALAQALQSRACAAVIGWYAGDDETALRRLQLAAESAGCWTLLFRPAARQALRSPAPLRIQLEKQQGSRSLVLQIRKRRGGPPTAVTVPIP